MLQRCCDAAAMLLRRCGDAAMLLRRCDAAATLQTDHSATGCFWLSEQEAFHDQTSPHAPPQVCAATAASLPVITSQRAQTSVHVCADNKQESVCDVEPHTQINPRSPRMEMAHRGGASQVIISHLKHLEQA